MRESNFYFPAHNKASVSITSALYDRRGQSLASFLATFLCNNLTLTSPLFLPIPHSAIDATSPLPLLSTLTHLSYLTSTSPRIREILCADGGLERLISILRSTGGRMREHRRDLQLRQEQLHLLIHTNPNQPLINSIQLHSQLIPQPTSINHLSIQPSSTVSASLSSPQSHPHFAQIQPAAASTSNSFAHPSKNLIRASPFRSFIDQSSSSLALSLSHLDPQPPIPTPLTPLTTQPIPAPSNPTLSSHQAPSIGLTKEQKQLLWTWSLSFQCVVNIGVRGTESIRTRVVEAGVVPVIISVLGSYLHEMDRVRQQSENLERARKKAALEAAATSSSLTHSRHISSSGRASSSSIDLPRPPRPVLSSRTLAHALPNSSSSSISISGLPSSFPTNHHHPSNPIVLPPSPSPPLPLNSPINDSDLTVTMNSTAAQSTSRPTLQQHRQFNGEQHNPHGNLRPITSTRPGRSNPISINSTDDPVTRTGSISPSSVSSSSSLETSRLNINRQPILRNAGSSSSSSSTLAHPSDLIDVDIDTHHGQRVESHTVPEPRSRVDEVMDDQSVADDSEADVVMELVGNDEPGPSSGHQRSRRGTIKASQVNPHKVVHITPLAPPRPTLTELSHDNLPRLNIQTQSSPMEGVEGVVDSLDENSASTILYANHQTPRASSARLPSHPASGRLHQAQLSSTTESAGPASEDTPMATSTESIPQAAMSDSLSSTSETDDSPPLHLSLRAPQNIVDPDAGQLPPVITDIEDVAPARTFATPPRPVVQHVNLPAAVPTLPADGLADQVAVNPPTNRHAAPPSVGSTSLSSPVTLVFRDEDVLLALQLLAYLSKYAHVRAYFHEPANRSTLELTYGSLQDATRALARFTGRFKSDRYERERGKDISTGPGTQGPSRRPSSLHGHQSPADVGGAHLSHDYSDRVGSTIHPNHSHHPHRSYSSSMMRDRLVAEELSRPTRSGRSSGDISSGFGNSGTPSCYPGSDSFLRPGLPLGGVTLFSTSPLVNNNFPQSLRQPNFALGQSGTQSMPVVTPTSHYSNHRHLSQPSAPHVGSSHNDLDSIHHHHHHHHSRAQFPHSNSAASLPHLQSTINPLASNVFSYVERFTHQRLPNDPHSPIIPSEIQYWAGVIMRNACRKDETRGGIRQCANMQCGRWESVPREFAKCKRCRKAKYCSKNCQSRAWQHGHRFWCSTRTEGEGSTTVNTNVTTVEGEGANSTPNETNETAVDEATRRIDRTSRALVDAAIERLRRTGDTAGGGGGIERNIRRELMGEVSDVGSNIPTPPDRDLRVENRLNMDLGGTGTNTANTNAIDQGLPVLVGPVIINNDGRTANTTPVALVNRNDPHHLVDERDQIRLLVDNHDDDHIINA